MHTSSLRLDGDKRNVEDIANTFKIIYASTISGPSEFGPHVLISALRAARTYDCPELRKFCVECLEKCEERLSPIQRIELARVFDPNSREVATYDEMCKRDRPLTEAEAKNLGMLAMAAISGIRKLEKQKNDSKAKGVRTHEYLALEAWGQEPPKSPAASECGFGRSIRLEKEKEKERLATTERIKIGWKEGKEKEVMEMEERACGYEETLKEPQGQKEWAGQGGKASDRENRGFRKQEVAITWEHIRIREEAAHRSRAGAGIWTEEQLEKKEMKRREMEEQEMEERNRGYEEAIRQHQGRTKREEQTRKTKQMSDLPRGGDGRDAPSLTFSAVIAHNRAMARLVSEDPGPTIDAPKQREGHENDTEGDSAGFDFDRAEASHYGGDQSR